jgi:hypothetical protein
VAAEHRRRNVDATRPGIRYDPTHASGEDGHPPTRRRLAVPSPGRSQVRPLRADGPGRGPGAGRRRPGGGAPARPSPLARPPARGHAPGGARGTGHAGGTGDRGGAGAPREGPGLAPAILDPRAAASRRPARGPCLLCRRAPAGGPPPPGGRRPQRPPQGSQLDRHPGRAAGAGGSAARHPPPVARRPVPPARAGGRASPPEAQAEVLPRGDERAAGRHRGDAVAGFPGAPPLGEEDLRRRHAAVAGLDGHRGATTRGSGERGHAGGLDEAGGRVREVDWRGR